MRDLLASSLLATLIGLLTPVVMGQEPAKKPALQLQSTLAGHRGAVSAVVWSKDGLIVTGGSDHTVRIWDAGTGKALHVLRGHTKAVTSVAITADGRFSASGSLDLSVRLWSRSGKLVRTMRVHEPRRFARRRPSGIRVAFSPDGKLLATGGADDTVRLWDVASGRQIRLLRNAGREAVGLVFSRDGKGLLSTWLHNGAILWDVSSGQKLLQISHAVHRPVRWLLTPQSRRMIGYTGSHGVNLWEVPSGRGVVQWVGSGPRGSISSLSMGPARADGGLGDARGP
ncbi:hypothetical protein JYT15_01100, partial [Acidimicrobium ferrooxidans]|nr:hypothetical protein [Acidimicrobium ferrooxidans]